MAHRTLVIGINNRGRKLADVVNTHPQFELTGIADLNPKRLEDHGNQLDIEAARHHTDYKAALSSGAFDVAVVALPNHLHYPAAKDALQAGMHCLVEKPFTLELAHAEELVALAEKKKLVLMVAQNYRTTPPLPFIRQAIDQKYLGRLAGVQACLHRNRGPRSEQEQQLPCSVLFIQGIHHLDWLRTALPAPVKTVIGRFERPAWSKWKCPSICHVMLECEDGVLVSYQASYDSRGEITTYTGRWRFEFETGDLIVDDNRDVWEISNCGQKRRIIQKFDAEADKDAPLFDSLHRAIENGTEPPTSGRDNLKTLKIILDIVQSATQRHSDSPGHCQ